MAVGEKVIEQQGWERVGVMVRGRVGGEIFGPHLLFEKEEPGVGHRKEEVLVVSLVQAF